MGGCRGDKEHRGGAHPRRPSGQGPGTGRGHRTGQDRRHPAQAPAAGGPSRHREVDDRPCDIDEPPQAPSGDTCRPQSGEPRKAVPGDPGRQDRQDRGGGPAGERRKAHRPREGPCEGRTTSRILLLRLRKLFRSRRPQLPQLRQEQDRQRNRRKQPVRRHPRHARVGNAPDVRGQGEGEHHPPARRRYGGDRGLREGGEQDQDVGHEGPPEEEQPPEEIQHKDPRKTGQGPLRHGHRSLGDRAPGRREARPLRRTRQDRSAGIPEGHPRIHPRGP